MAGCRKHQKIFYRITQVYNWKKRDKVSYSWEPKDQIRSKLWTKQLTSKNIPKRVSGIFLPDASEAFINNQAVWFASYPDA